jgi:hypothetical protein
MLFAGTIFGELRAIKFPLSDAVAGIDEFTEYRFHNLPITRITTSFHERYLFTAGQDGCIWIFKLTDKDGKLAKREKDWEYSDEILFTKSDLNDSYTVIADLKKKVEEIATESENKMMAKDEGYDRKTKQVIENFEDEIQALEIVI